MKKTYAIEVDCAVCADKMEKAAQKTFGVKEASVNFLALKMTIEFDQGADIDTVMNEVYKNCRKVENDCKICF